MITRHLTDDEIQEFVLDPAVCKTGIAGHVRGCEQCRTKAVNYRLLVTGIKLQPPPVFDFNLAESVLAQLPAKKAGFRREELLIYLVVFGGLVLAGMSFYVFRSYIGNILTGITPILIYLMAVTFLIILVMYVIDMHKNYQEKMNELDLY
jgi:hypothetical protein